MAAAPRATSSARFVRPPAKPSPGRILDAQHRHWVDFLEQVERWLPSEAVSRYVV